MMKKLLLSLTLVISAMTAKSQVVLFADSFETYTDFTRTNIGSWLLLDIDLRPTYGFNPPTTFPTSGAAGSFIVFNPTAVTPALTPSSFSNWTAKSGVRSMACFAAVPNATVTKNNDWLISPQILLGTTGNTLTFWAKSCDSIFAAEKFTVNVATVGGVPTPANFTKISTGAFIQTAFGPYVQYTYNLDAYQGQNVRIGINCVSEDQFGFMLDDFRVTATTASYVNPLTLKGISMYPNPAKSVLTIEKGDANIIDVTITDLNCKVLKVAKDNLANISVADLTQGMYMVTINTTEGKKVEKLTID